MCIYTYVCVDIFFFPFKHSVSYKDASVNPGSTKGIFLLLIHSVTLDLGTSHRAAQIWAGTPLNMGFAIAWIHD